MIRNYDTNGLIFALNPESVNMKETDGIFIKAAENILDSQHFYCIPLIDNPRIRNNTNNMKNRATYDEGGGNITHIVRKSRYDDEDNIVYIPINDIPHVGNTTDLVDAIIKLFSYDDGKKCNFVITVGGTKKQPDALFTLRELLLEKTKKELFMRMAHQGIKSGNQELSNNAFLLYEELDKIVDVRDWKVVKSTLDKIKYFLELIPRSDQLSNNRTSDLSVSTNFSDLKVRDIMTAAASGLDIAVLEESNKGKRVLQLAFTMLSKANDFDRLVVYENGILSTQKVLLKKQNGDFKIQQPASTSKTTDSIKGIISNMKNSTGFYAIIEPDVSILTGEGPMIWPGFMTISELTDTKAMLSYAATCAMIEHELKVRAKSCGIEMDPKGKDTLGSLIVKITRKKNKSFIHKNAMKIFTGRVTKDELHNLINIRNRVIHESLRRCYDGSIKIKNFNIKDVKLIYKVAESLEII